MYLPDAFRIDTAEQAQALIRQNALALLVVVQDGAPEFSPVPVMLDEHVGPFGRLRFHLARANPVAEILARDAASSLVFSGAQTYVSPDWYTDRKLPPTWNYEVVVARGRVTPLDDDGLRALLDDLSADQERRLDKRPWTPDKMGEERIRGLMRGIVGFAVEIEVFEGKAKLSQNRADADRESLGRALSEANDPDARAVAARMKND